MKKYKLKPRFYVIAATTGLLITGFTLVHIDSVCSAQVAEAPPAIEIAEPINEAPELASLGEYKITHYCSCCECCGKSNGVTASGEIAEADQTIAVDPEVIPLGSTVYINGQEYIAEDVGGAIKGDRIDIYCSSHAEAVNKGVLYAEVYLEAKNAD